MSLWPWLRRLASKTLIITAADSRVLYAEARTRTLTATARTRTLIR